jgi:Lrp/AsnC family transcriptional regulator, leucine-responsive regulatory protein
MAVNPRSSALYAVDSLVDDVNRLILAELQADARVTLAELGRRVGLSAPAVAERLQRLESDGVIRAYRAEIDPRALGLTLGAVLRIRPAPRQLHKVAVLAQQTPEVTECHRITGEDCFLIKVHAATVAGLEEVLDLFLVHGQTVSTIVVTSPVPGRPLPIPD